MCTYIISIYEVNYFLASANRLLHSMPKSAFQQMSAGTIQSCIRDFVAITGIRYDAVYPLYIDKSIHYTLDTIYKDGVNVSNPCDVLWCIPSRNYHVVFSKDPTKRNTTVDNILLDSIIWYNLIDKVYSSQGDNWYHTQHDNSSYDDLRMFNALATLVILGMRQVSLHHKRNDYGTWTAPRYMTYAQFIYDFLNLLKDRLLDNSLVPLIMEKNRKNFRSTYGLSDKSAGVHTVKAYQTSFGKYETNKTNTTTMNYIHSDETVLQKYKDNGSYDIIASDLPSREAAKAIKEELGINISHVTIQHCRNRIARLQAKKNSEEPCLNP